MDLRELKELLELISERDITEFELEEEGVKLRIKKGSSLAVPDQASNNHPPAAPALSVSAVPVDSPSLATAPEPELDKGLVLVRSPMVGTFYRAPDPNAPPFVKEGDRVKVGQVLCIIEAMKLMNEIESEHAGEMVRIYVENGQPVQYGDELFAIRLAS